jgi:hypothetical protein
VKVRRCHCVFRTHVRWVISRRPNHPPSDFGSYSSGAIACLVGSCLALIATVGFGCGESVSGDPTSSTSAWIVAAVLRPPVQPNDVPSPTVVAVSDGAVLVGWSGLAEIDQYDSRFAGFPLTGRMKLPAPASSLVLGGGALAVGMAAADRTMVFAAQGKSEGWSPMTAPYLWDQSLTGQPPGAPPSALIGEWFGASVAIVDDAFAVSAPDEPNALGDGEGHVVLFQRSGSGWTYNPPCASSLSPNSASLHGPPDPLCASEGDQHFGHSVAMTATTIGGVVHEVLAVGRAAPTATCPGSSRAFPGHAYLYDRAGSDPWAPDPSATLAPVHPVDYGAFGNQVAIGGDTVVVAQGDVFSPSDAFELDGFAWPGGATPGGTLASTWSQKIAGPVSGMAFDGQTLVVGVGSVIEVYSRTGPGVLCHLLTLTAPDASPMVAISGDTIVAAAGSSASVFQFQATGSFAASSSSP